MAKQKSAKKLTAELLQLIQELLPQIKRETGVQFYDSNLDIAFRFEGPLEHDDVIIEFSHSHHPEHTEVRENDYHTVSYLPKQRERLGWNEHDC